MIKKNISASLLIGGMGLVGLVAGAATIASAQIASTSPVVTSSAITASTSVDKPESANDVADIPDANEGAHKHFPMGGDGVVASVNGTTIVMAEESDEGNGSYTVDASTATVTNEGATAKLSDLKVGDKIFVEGVTTGTSVKATMVSLGHPGEKRDHDSESHDGPDTPDNTDN